MAAQKLRKTKSADALRSIGEAAKELGLQTHVLRYWEGKFPKQIKPIKRSDGRRMFRPEDMDALRAIQLLVHDRGLTLKGAKALLNEQGVTTVLNGDARLIATAEVSADIAAVESPARDLQKIVSEAFRAELPDTSHKATGSVERLKSVLSEMTSLKQRLDKIRAA